MEYWKKTHYLCLKSKDSVSDSRQVFGGDVFLQDLVKVRVGRQGQKHSTAIEPVGQTSLIVK